MLRRNIATFLRHSVKKRHLATSTAEQAETLSKYPVGLQLHGFNIKEVQPVPEFSLVAVKLLHERTGLEHLHLDSPTDKNNVFAVALKTNPPDATGVPHILEHTTLCGSHKYPVRDPFFKMLNRSLSNFMNAMTGHDYTYYPFATTNRTDFYNLMDVYLSSVFEPLLNYEDFMQEGWRLEQLDMTDRKSDIEFKGVVYNEMKGQYSNSSYLYWIKFQEAIYASLNNSGGDPAAMIDLHYEDLIDFHSFNYHPSNSKTFTYGNFQLTEHLEKLNAFYNKFGKRSGKRDVKKSIFDLDPKTARHDVEVSGPVDTMTTSPLESQLKSSITWYLGNPLEESEQYNVFKWKILSTLLLDGHNAPFYQELIETGYGEDFSPNAGLDITTAMLSFTIGLNNLTREKVENLGSVIRKTLSEKVIPELSKGHKSYFHDRVEAILHQLELGFKKHKPDFGLGLLGSLLPMWINGLNPINALKVEKILTRFKEDYKEHGLRLFSEMLHATLLNESAPQFRFTMVPEETFNKDLASAEQKRLASKVSKLDEEDKEKIFQRGKNLLEKQQQKEDVSVLPTLTVADIPRRGDFFDISFTEMTGGDRKIQKRITNTNDLVYVSAAKDLSFLPIEYYKYLPLFNLCLTNLAGTSNTSIFELENKIQKYTGGVTFTTIAKANPFDIGKTNFKYVMSGMSLRDNAKHLYDIWADVLCNTKFNESDDAVVEKLVVLIKNLGQNQLNTIADRGHVYANAYSNAQLTTTKHINDVLGGIEQVKFILELNRRLEAEGRNYLKEEVLPVLQKIQRSLLNDYAQGSAAGFNYNIVSDKASVIENEELIKKFDENLAKSQLNCTDNALENFSLKFRSAELSKTVLDLPFQVGYSSLATLGAAYTTKDGAALQALSQILTFKHLHSVIRESNGAYGGGLNFDGLGGTLNYYSYRDPNAVKSIEAFNKAPEIARAHLNDRKWDERDLQEAKLAIFQSVDAPSHISSEGSAQFLEGITDEMRQERRERFLDVTLQDLQDVNEKYLVKPAHRAETIIGDVSNLGEVGNDWNVRHFR